MADIVADLLDAVAPVARSLPVLPWAVVSQVSPLEVTFPGDSAGVPASQLDHVPALSVGDRVGVLRFGLAWTVVGRFS